MNAAIAQDNPPTLISGNDRFMVGLVDDHLFVMSFDPGWDLRAESFEPLKIAADDVSRGVSPPRPTKKNTNSSEFVQGPAPPFAIVRKNNNGKGVFQSSNEEDSRLRRRVMLL